MPEILALGPNPAWQKVLFFSRFQPHEVNRAERVQTLASGKGVNFSRAVRTFGSAGVKVMQFAGGDSGTAFESALQAEGIPFRSVRTQAATRICTTLVCRETNTATELIEPSGTVLPAELENMLAAVKEELLKSEGLALCGTYPPGVPETFYAELAAFAAEHGKKVLVDSYKGIRRVLENRISILKINQAELAELTGTDGGAEAASAFFREHALEALAITCGSNPALLCTKSGMQKISVPEIKHPVNPIGAGDTCSGVFFSEYLCGKPAAEAFAAGLSAASASCLTELPAFFERETALLLNKQIKMERVC